MKLREAKDKVYMLLDEHSAGGEVEHDEDIEEKMLYFFDMAQKELSKLRRIVKVKTVVRQSGKTEYAMPENFWRLLRVWRDGKPATDRYRWKGEKLIIPERDTAAAVEVEYYAMPETIDSDAGDDYEFELDEDACNCMPYYVAAQQLLPDLVTDCGAFLRMYQMAVSSLPPNTVGEGLRIRQGVW